MDDFFITTSCPMLICFVMAEWQGIMQCLQCFYLFLSQNISWVLSRIYLAEGIQKGSHKIKFAEKITNSSVSTEKCLNRCPAE